ncbi:MAG: glycosyltransferase family 4 protein, partial [bacterium]|nr:glycosyltransferase family 4 protein [bacterium]
GVIAPCKTYASLKVGSPVVLSQGRESDLSRILADGVEGIAVGPDQADKLVRYIRELKSNPERLAAGRERNGEWYRRNCSLDTNARAMLEEVRRVLNGTVRG